MTTTVYSGTDPRDPDYQARLAYIAAREAREAEDTAQIAALRELQRPQREAEQAAVSAAREAARNAPPTRAQEISADIREAMTGSREPATPRAADSIRAKTRELLAITRARSQARPVQ